MWTKIPHPWRICLEETWYAYCAGSVPVGAAVMNDKGDVLARGRNQIGDNGNGSGPVRNHQLAHAELNALLSFDSEKVDSTCALYAILEPCPLCFGAFYMSGLRQLHFAAREPLGGSTNLLNMTPYLKRKPIRIYHPDNSELETLVIALNVEYVLRTYGDHAENLLKWWRDILPEGVTLGEKLSQSGRLLSMSREGLGVKEMAEEFGTLITREQ
jgi:tRNA(Arg) A34 adenosine deaminase TadA